MLRVLGTWVAATLAFGVLAAATRPASVGVLDVLDVAAGPGRTAEGATRLGADGSGGGAASTVLEVPAGTVPSTLVPGASPTTRPPTPPQENPTEGDVPPDLRPLDPATGAPPPSGTLAGRVVGRDGRPAVGICITVDLPARAGIVTDADGRWSTTADPGPASPVVGIHLRDCDGVAPHWLPHDDFATHLLVTGRSTTVLHTLERAGSLEVTVVDQWDRPQPGLCVTTAGIGGPVTAATDHRGRAAFPAVPPGSDRTAGVGITCTSAPVPIDQPTTTVLEGGAAQLRLVLPRPDNDDRRRAWALAGRGEVASGGILATTEADEALPGCAPRGPVGTVWYRRTPTAGPAPAAHLRNIGAGGPGSAIAVHREVAGVLVEAACVVPGPAFPRPEVAVPVAAGEVVWIQVVTTLGGIQHATAYWSDE